MGWNTIRKLLLGCCGGRRKTTVPKEDDNILSDDLRDPRNQALLPRPKSGCRGYFVICDDGQVVQLRNPPIECNVPVSARKLPGPGHDIPNAAAHTSADSKDDNIMIENNRDMFWDTWGPRIQAGLLSEAMAAEKSSTEGSTICEYGGSARTVEEVSQKMPNSSPPTSGEENIVVTSGEEKITGDRKVGGQNEDCKDNRPTIEARRKGNLPQSVVSAHAGEMKCPANKIDVVEAVVIESNGNVAAAFLSDDNIRTFGNLENDTMDSIQRPNISIPILSENPDAFWKLFWSLKVQLGPFLNPLAPNVMRPHNWDTDGCICKYLLQPVNQEDGTK